MADQTFVVTDAVKAGVLDLGAHANSLAGTAAGADQFLMPNDGKTILVTVCGAGPAVITVTAVPDKYGRTETLTWTPSANVTCCFGPLSPELFNNASGQVEFDPAGGGVATDKYLALRVANPS